MHKPIDVVEVRIWGKRVGAVALEPGQGFYAFEYDPSFVKRKIELAPLQMPLAQASAPFIFPGLALDTYKRLPAMLADALPDRFGNALIDAEMSRLGVTASQITPLDRLAYMGKRGMGALEFKPALGSQAKSNTTLALALLVEQARRALQGDFDGDEHADAALQSLIKVGTSAGGARAKAAIAWQPETHEVRAGQFDVEQGFEHWLLKFDLGPDKVLGQTQDYGRIEYAYHKMAIAAGITMADCRLLEEGGRAHFLTKRFDRDGNKKHHTQTLCALAHADFNLIAAHDYHQYFLTIADLNLGSAVMAEAFRRMAFNYLAANCDDHTKNFSFLLKEGGSWELAPAYDLTYAYDPDNKWTCQHLMAMNGNFTSASRDHMLRFADKYSIGSARGILDKVQESVSMWPTFAKAAGVSKRETERIRAHLAAT